MYLLALSRVAIFYATTDKYLYYHKNDGSASIFGMMREDRSLKFKLESLKLTAHNRRDYEGQKG